MVVARRPPWIVGERLDSWLLRIAAAHDTPVGLLAESLGLWGPWLQRPAPVEDEMVPDGRVLASAAGLLDVDLGVVDEALGWPRRRRGVSWSGYGSLTTLPAGSPYCPRCLESDGGWRTRWCLPWVVDCPEHGCRLVAVCPSCGAVPGSGRLSCGAAVEGVRGGLFRPRSVVPGPTWRCLNAVKTTDGWQPCPGRLPDAEVPAGSSVGPSVDLDVAQPAAPAEFAVVDRLLAGTEPSHRSSGWLPADRLRTDPDRARRLLEEPCPTRGRS